MISEKKVTVIIPTLCKSMDIMPHTLKELESNLNIASIIIFDNTLGSFTSALSKVQIHNKENLYVNPAWNKGLELCNTDYFLLLNDDIVCSSETVNACIKIFNTHNNIELATVSTTNINDPVTESDIVNYITINNKIEDPVYFIQGTRYGHINFSGWFIFGRKASWEPIPKGLNIFYGDNLIYYRKDDEHPKICCITNYIIYHRVSTTCKQVGVLSNNAMGSEHPYYVKELKRINKA